MNRRERKGETILIEVMPLTLYGEKYAWYAYKSVGPSVDELKDEMVEQKTAISSYIDSLRKNKKLDLFLK